MQAQPERSAVYRRAATSPRTVRDLVFDRLPPAVRDRLTHGVVHGAPEPLLAAPSGSAPLVLRALTGVALAAAAAMIGLAAWDFAALRGAKAWQPESFAAAYGALFFLLAVAGAGAFEIRRFQRGAPFRSGRYLFPLDLVEVSGGRLRVTALDTIRDVEARGRSVAVRFEDGHAVVFPLARHDDPAVVEARVRSAIRAAGALACPADAAAIERLDPFFELRLAKDWDAAAAAKSGRRARAPMVWIAAGAALAAVPAGHGILRARNALSDDMMFEEARTRRPGEAPAPKLLAYTRCGRRHVPEAARALVDEIRFDVPALRRLMAGGGELGELAAAAFLETADDPEVLSQYLARGGEHADEVDDALFAMARRLDTISAYDTYLEHGRRHEDEVRHQLLPHAEFAQASRSRLVGTMLSFLRRNPGSAHEEEAWRRIRAAYAGAFPAFLAAGHRAPEGHSFAQALLATLQDRADPRVDLSIEMVSSTKPVTAADDERGKSYLATFEPRALEDLSETIRVAVGSWFGRAFPDGVVETTRPSGAEGRPRIEIRCKPVGLGGSGPEIVSLVLGVRGVVPARDGKDVTIAWEVRADANDDGHAPAERIRGPLARLQEAASEQIAASFHEKL
jgi:hypothetical protein